MNGIVKDMDGRAKELSKQIRSRTLILKVRCNGFLQWKYCSSSKTKSQQVLYLGTMCLAKQPFKTPLVESHKQSQLIHFTGVLFVRRGESHQQTESLLYQDCSINYLCQLVFTDHLRS